MKLLFALLILLPLAANADEPMSTESAIVAQHKAAAVLQKATEQVQAAIAAQKEAAVSTPAPITPVALAPTIAPVVTPIDLTPILLAIVSAVLGSGGILSIVISAIVNARMKDKKDAATMESALQNGLGAINRAADGKVVALNPQISLPGVPDDVLTGVQYALDHAGDEFKRAGITPLAVASKINARLGVSPDSPEPAAVVAPVAHVAPSWGATA